ncbi:MAG: PadR family transcriptional regulator, partial [Candidatus Fimenecus sp.]
LEIASENAFEMTEGTLYPILHALEKDGYLESYWQEFDGRNRKYYHITRKGLRELEKEKKEWESFSKSVAKVLNYV